MSDARRVQQNVQGLAADLDLIDQLDKIRAELVVLDNRCTFLEGVYGRDDQRYKDAHVERDLVLLRADKLIAAWVRDREHLPTPRA